MVLIRWKESGMRSTKGRGCTYESVYFSAYFHHKVIFLPQIVLLFAFSERLNSYFLYACGKQSRDASINACDLFFSIRRKCRGNIHTSYNGKEIYRGDFRQ